MKKIDTLVSNIKLTGGFLLAIIPILGALTTDWGSVSLEYPSDYEDAMGCCTLISHIMYVMITVIILLKSGT